MFKSSVKWLMANAVVSVVLLNAESAAKNATRIDQRSTLSRVLLLAVIGGISYATLSEFERTFKPASALSPIEMIQNKFTK